MGSPTTRAGGRSRDEGAHLSVLEATRELLAEVGYARLTVEAISKRAGVPKPTIYRWWDGKAAIVGEAIWAPVPDDHADTGSFEGDLRVHVARIVDYFGRPDVVAALPGLLSESFAGGPSAERLAGHTGGGTEQLRTLLRTAQKEGLLRASVGVGMVCDVIIGALFSRIIARTMQLGTPTGTRPSDVDELMEILVGGVLSDR